MRELVREVAVPSERALVSSEAAPLLRHRRRPFGRPACRVSEPNTLLHAHRGGRRKRVNTLAIDISSCGNNVQRERLRVGQPQRRRTRRRRWASLIMLRTMLFGRAEMSSRFGTSELIHSLLLNCVFVSFEYDRSSIDVLIYTGLHFGLDRRRDFSG